MLRPQDSTATDTPQGDETMVATQLHATSDEITIDPLEIVMIDDDPEEHLLMTLAAQDAALDANFQFFEDGADALLHLVERPRGTLPDLIVLDLRMPGFDGHRTLDEIQAHHALRTVPVVVFTSSPRPQDERLSMERGAAACIVKPSGFADMVDVADQIRRIAMTGALAEAPAVDADAREQRREPLVAIGQLVDDYLDLLVGSPSDDVVDTGN